MIHLADPNPALLAVLALGTPAVLVLIVMYVREIDRNGRAQEANRR